MGKLNKNNIVAAEKKGNQKASGVIGKKNATLPSDSVAVKALPAKINKAKKQKQLTSTGDISAEIVPAPKSKKTKVPVALPIDTSVAETNDSDSEHENELEDSAVSKQKGGMCYLDITLYSINT